MRGEGVILSRLPYIDSDGRKSNLLVIRPFGVMIYYGIYVCTSITQ